MDAAYIAAAPRPVLVRPEGVPGPLAIHEPVFDAMLDGVVAVDAEGIIVAFNPAAQELFGYPDDAALGSFLFDLLLPVRSRERHRSGFRRLVESGWSPLLDGRIEEMALRADGTEFPIELIITRVSDSPHYAAFIRDLSPRLERERELEELARENALILDSAGDGILRLDNAGFITFANPAAGEILGCQAHELIGLPVHETLHPARDEEAHGPAECPSHAALRGAPHHTTCEVFLRRDGSSFPVDYTTAPIRTDSGIVGAVCIFADITEQRRREDDLRDRAKWTERIHRALREGSFVLHGQPIVSLGPERAPVMHELLLRMRDKDGLRPPSDFLPHAERFGLTAEIDRWVVAQATELAASRRVSVNLSARGVADSSLVEFIEAEIERHGTEPSNLVFEITETAALEDFDLALRLVRRLTDMGCGFAMDDFGTGYGSFTELRRLPLDYLKIDRAFIKNVATDPGDRLVVSSIVAVARNFGMETIAEGVEERRTLEALGRLGVDHVQGYLLGRPRPLERLLRAV